MSETQIVKTTPPTAAAKLDQVIKWVVSGATEFEIEEAIAAAWPADRPQPLIVKAMAAIGKSAAADESLVRGWCFEATRSVYAKAIERGDNAVALAAIKQLAALAKN